MIRIRRFVRSPRDSNPSARLRGSESYSYAQGNTNRCEQLMACMFKTSCPKISWNYRKGKDATLLTSSLLMRKENTPACSTHRRCSMKRWKPVTWNSKETLSKYTTYIQFLRCLGERFCIERVDHPQLVFPSNNNNYSSLLRLLRHVLRIVIARSKGGEERWKISTFTGWKFDNVANSIRVERCICREGTDDNE